MPPDPMAVLHAGLGPGYSVPRIIVGGWQLSDGHHAESVRDGQALDDLTRFADAGLIAFDCADIYTGVEELLGRFRRAYRASRGAAAADLIRVHTKFVPDRDALQTIDRKYVRRIIDRSLERLGVDRLDLVQFAWWNYEVERYVAVASWLMDLCEDGKIARLGVTNFDVPRMRALIKAEVRLVSHQVQYSVLDRRPDNGMVRFCRHNDIQLLAYGSLAGGFLTDAWLDTPEPRPPMANRSLTKYRLIIQEFGTWEVFQNLLRVLRDIADKHGVAIANVAARWVLERDQVASVILGARDARHLDQNLDTLRCRLDDGDERRIADAIRGRGPEGDVFGLERIPGGAHARIMRDNLNRD